MAILKLDWRTFGLMELTGSETTRLVVKAQKKKEEASEEED